MWDKLFQQYGRIQPVVQAASKTKTLVLDATGAEDNVNNRSAVFQEQAIALDAMNLLSEWFETTEEDLEVDEGLGDRLFSLLVSLADDVKDGEISDDEADIINVGANAMYEYLVSKGVSDENAVALLEDFDNEIASNIHAFILSKLPEGEDALSAEMDDLIFADYEQEPMLDSILHDNTKAGLTLDAAYRKVFAIRHGKKVKINKRVAGKVRLSAKQRVAIKKAQRRAHTGAARLRRLKSFRLHKRVMG